MVNSATIFDTLWFHCRLVRGLAERGCIISVTDSSFSLPFDWASGLSRQGPAPPLRGAAEIEKGRTLWYTKQARPNSTPNWTPTLHKILPQHHCLTSSASRRKCGILSMRSVRVMSVPYSWRLQPETTHEVL